MSAEGRGHAAEHRGRDDLLVVSGRRFLAAARDAGATHLPRVRRTDELHRRGSRARRPAASPGHPVLRLPESGVCEATDDHRVDRGRGYVDRPSMELED